MIPVVEGQLLLWIHKGIKENPLLLFSPDDDQTSDDTNHSGGVEEICECVIGKKKCARDFMASFLCLFLHFLSLNVFVSFLLSTIVVTCSFCPLYVVFLPSCESHNYSMPISCGRHSIINEQVNNIQYNHWGAGN